jgi:hypothetical protein
MLYGLIVDKHTKTRCTLKYKVIIRRNPLRRKSSKFFHIQRMFLTNIHIAKQRVVFPDRFSEKYENKTVDLPPTDRLTELRLVDCKYQTG